LLLHDEAVVVGRHRVDGDTVRVETVTHEREQRVELDLAHERVEIEHVPVGRVVESVPEIRRDADVTIIPVVEEVLVVERRLVLKEEIHIRRIRGSVRHQETVMLRRQEAVVTRVSKAGETEND
jgi:stress response protein YsnF